MSQQCLGSTVQPWTKSLSGQLAIGREQALMEESTQEDHQKTALVSIIHCFESQKVGPESLNTLGRMLALQSKLDLIPSISYGLPSTSKSDP